jgi:acyl-coenzyme A thioesterase PaaI-like protein
MRSGTGGIVRAVAECSRHGQLAGTAEIRVVEGGCSTPPERGARDRAGAPEIRLPRSVRLGEVIEVRARVRHASYTGLVLREGRFVRELPDYFIRQMLVTLDDERVSEFQMTAAVSPNPLIRLPLRVARAGGLRVVFVNSEGERWEASQPLRV